MTAVPAADPGASGAAPHVVMLVANDVRADTRVRKSALAVAAAGLRVTVVGITTGPRRWDTVLGEPPAAAPVGAASAGPGSSPAPGQVRIVRVPVDFVLSQARKDRRARWHGGQIPFLLPDREREALARRRLAAAESQASVGSGAEGLTGAARRQALSARRFVLRAEGAGRRKGVRAATLAFKVWDRGWQQITWGAGPHRIVPEIDDLELAVAPVLEALEPDLIHAHDVHLIGIAARAGARAAAGGRTVRWLYDAHEWVPGLSRYGGRTARVIAAWAQVERDFIADADRVLTVSPPLAEALQTRYGLPRRPDVVLNVPPLGARAADAASVRDHSGVPDGVPLLVYSGGVQAARGVTTAVEALVALPQAHLAVVAVPSIHTAPVAALRTRAEQLGVADRLHLVPPVAPDQVSSFLAGADVGLIPLLHFGSHEMALANKLFEYLHAGVPMVVSDCRAQADFVTEHGLGQVHPAGDAAALAAAVTRVLADPDGYAARLADPDLLSRYTWQSQARALRAVYADLLDLPPSGAVDDPAQEPPERLVLGTPPADVVLPAVADATAAGTAAGHSAVTPVFLAIGPANSAGQAWAWSGAARRLPAVATRVLAIRNGRYDYPADELVDRAEYLRGTAWQLRTLADARSRWTHVLLEAGRPILGGLAGRDFVADADLLTRSGVRVGLVLHGSETRNPRRHRAGHEFSPFSDPRDDLTRRLQLKADALLPLVTAFAADGGPVFVSTPDQLDDVPSATWLPVVVDPGQWSVRGDTLTRDVPLFVHAPSNPTLKGTAEVERVLGPLAERGLIDFRLITGLPPQEAAALIADADVVVDQLLLGLYGVLACEAMAAGRLVLGHVGETLRSRVDREVPVVEVTPRTLAEVVERVLDDRDWARARAARGPQFVAAVHDGRRSAAALAPFLGRTISVGADGPDSVSVEVPGP